MNKNDKNLNILYEYIKNNLFNTNDILTTTYSDFFVNHCKIENNKILLKITRIKTDEQTNTQTLKNSAIFEYRIEYDKNNNIDCIYCWYTLYNNNNDCIISYDSLIYSLRDIDSMVYTMLNVLTEISYF